MILFLGWTWRVQKQIWLRTWKRPLFHTLPLFRTQKVIVRGHEQTLTPFFVSALFGYNNFPPEFKPCIVRNKKAPCKQCFSLPLSVLFCSWSPASSRWLPGFFFCLTMYKIRNERSWFYTLESYTLKVHRLSFWLVGFWEIAGNHKFRIWKRPPGRESADTAHNSQVLPGSFPRVALFQGICVLI